MTSPAIDPGLDACRFGPFRIEPDTRQVLRDGEPLPLGGKPYDTLAALIRHRHRVVGKDELMKLVWPDAVVSDDSLTHSISVIRRALGDDSGQPQYIATIPRRGYRFIAPVEPDDVAAGDEPASGAPVVALPPVTSRHLQVSHWAVWAAAAVGVAAAIVVMTPGATLSGRTTPDKALRFTQSPPAGHEIASGAVLSPDGEYLAFVARDERTGVARLWVRSLSSSGLRELPGTDGAFRPFWSPDGRALAFFAQGKLKRTDVDGAPPRTLAAVGYRPSGGSWSTRGVIVYSDRQSPLYAVPESGGEPREVIGLDAAHRDVALRAPSFLPDGTHLLYYAQAGDPKHAGTYVVSLDEPRRPTRVLDATASPAVYAAPGYLLYRRDGALLAHPFDLATRQLTGEPTTIGASEIGLDGPGSVSASLTGLLTFGGDARTGHLTWHDRRGNRLGAVNAPTPLHNPALSPDGRFVAADGGGVWVIDLERDAPIRVTEEGANLPMWGPDARRIVFTTRRARDEADLALRTLGGAADTESVLLRTPEMKIGGSWTRDGRHVVYTASNARTRLDLWVLPLDGDRRPVPFLQTPFNEMQAQVSPDGRWIAYASDETGAWEVYLRPFPSAGGKVAVSVGGGAEPQWSGDSRELFYIAADGSLTVVDITAAATVAAGKPRPLFRTPIVGDTISYRNHYAVTADGQRFLVDSADRREPINVVVNWTALLVQ